LHRDDVSLVEAGETADLRGLLPERIGQLSVHCWRVVEQREARSRAGADLPRRRPANHKVIESELAFHRTPANEAAENQIKLVSFHRHRAKQTLPRNGLLLLTVAPKLQLVPPAKGEMVPRARLPDEGHALDSEQVAILIPDAERDVLQT